MKNLLMKTKKFIIYITVIISRFTPILLRTHHYESYRT